ncbi:MAG: BamA/TamA family outer membrane protein [Deltaproteobacteria bacterium]|nr:BamA/TamA family outer membrane protein [Deltaproteobacteria bacterium]
MNWLVIFLLGGIPAISFAQDLSERKIKSVEVQGVSPQDAEHIRKRLGLGIGQSFNRKLIDEGLRGLFAENRYQTIFVEQVPGDGPLRLVVHVSQNKNIRQIRFVGVDKEILEQVRNKGILEEGSSADMRKIAELREALRHAYETRGYYSAAIQILFDSASSGGQADLEVMVQAGSRTVVRRVTLSGVPKDDRVPVMSLISLKDGSGFSKDELDASIERINRYFRTNQFPTSRVEDYSLDFDQDKTAVNIHLSVKMGERLQFEFVGNRSLGTIALRELITEEITSQSDASTRIAAFIEEKYKALGYHFCKVQVVNLLEDQGRLKIIRFSIDEGQRVIIDDIIFTGEVRDHDKLVAAFFENAPGVLQRHLYWEEGVKTALTNFRNELLKMGYLSPTVFAPKVVFSEDKRGVRLIMNLDLGVQTILSSLKMEGVSQVAHAEVLVQLGLRTGNPLNKEALKDGMKKVIDYYQARGFIDAKFAHGGDGVVLTKNGADADILLRIDEGVQYRVGIISIEGNKKTQSAVILRELKVKTGDVYNPEAIRQSEDNIALLGLFSHVEILSQANVNVRDQKDLRVLVKELSPGLGEIGFGGTYEDPRFRLRSFLGLGYKNLLGLNHTVSARGEVKLPLSQDKLIPFIEYSAVLGYRAPYPWGVPLALSTQVGLDSQEISPSGPQVLTRARIEGKIEKKFSSVVTGYYRFYRYERTTIETLDGSKEASRESIGSTGPGIIIDFRDDPFNPTSGSYHVADLEFAHPLLLSQDEISFGMALIRHSFYFPIGRQIGLALYGGAGYARSFFSGKPIPKSRLLTDLSLGGRASLRGFSLHRFSPADTSEQTAFYNVRAELSSPLFANITGAIFVDSGQIFPDLVSQPRHEGVGIGLRYKTPVGPIGVDLAQSLGKDSEGVKFYFTVGSI